MLKELQNKFFELAFGPQSATQTLPPEVAANPLAHYLTLYHRQHRMVALLYRGLIFAFGLLLGLVSYLIFSALGEISGPRWAPYALVLLDIFLLWGLLKSASELKRYRAKNAEILEMVSEHLARDLKKLERIKAEQTQLIAQKKKISQFNDDLKAAQEDLGGAPRVPEPKGWDVKPCPKCGLKVDLLDEVCPHCFYLFGEIQPD